jgi:hypothetical protein
MKIKIKVPDLIILITIASTSLYIIFRNLGREVGSFAYLWAPITLLLIIIELPTTFTKAPMKILLLYGFIMVGILPYTLWKYMTDWNQIRISYEFYYLVVMTAILSYYLGKGDFKMLALLSKYSFIFVIISLITTNVALFYDPFLVRESASTGLFSDYQGAIYKLTGAMGYGYIQSIVCLIPILIYHIKSKQKMVFPPKVLIAILLLIFITEIRSQVFANMLVTALITILSFMGAKKQRNSFIILSLVGILIIAIPNYVYSSIFSNLSSYFDPGSQMYNKLNDFAIYIQFPELYNPTEAGSRVARYPLLFEALLANPVLGHASNPSGFDIMPGAHLYWMNRLALWGIFGFLFFIFVLLIIYRSVSSLFEPNYRFYYFLSVVAFVFLGLIKAVGGSESWLMLIVVIPGLYFLPLLQQTKKDIAIKKDNIMY